MVIGPNLDTSALPIERRSPRIASAFVQTVPQDARSGRFWLGRRRNLGCLTVTPAIRGDGRRTVSGVHEQNERQHHDAEYEDVGDQGSAVCHRSVWPGRGGSPA